MEFTFRLYALRVIFSREHLKNVLALLKNKNRVIYFDITRRIFVVNCYRNVISRKHYKENETEISQMIIIMIFLPNYLKTNFTNFEIKDD